MSKFSHSSKNNEKKYEFSESLSSKSNDYLPNLFFKVDFTDRAPLDVANKEKVDDFWNYVANNVCPLIDVNSFGSPHIECLTVPEEKSDGKKIQPWTRQLKEFKSLGLHKIATVSTKSCKIQKEDNKDYIPNARECVTNCSKLREWDKDFKAKFPLGTDITIKAYK